MFAAQLVGLPHRVDQFVNSTVDASFLALTERGLAPSLDEHRKFGQLVKDRPAGSFGWVSGKHGAKVSSASGGDNLGVGYAGCLQLGDGVGEMVVP